MELYESSAVVFWNRRGAGLPTLQKMPKEKEQGPLFMPHTGLSMATQEMQLSPTGLCKSKQQACRLLFCHPLLQITGKTHPLLCFVSVAQQGVLHKQFLLPLFLSVGLLLWKSSLVVAQTCYPLQQWSLGLLLTLAVELEPVTNCSCGVWACYQLQ